MNFFYIANLSAEKKPILFRQQCWRCPDFSTVRNFDRRVRLGDGFLHSSADLPSLVRLVVVLRLRQPSAAPQNLQAGARVSQSKRGHF